MERHIYNRVSGPGRATAAATGTLNNKDAMDGHIVTGCGIQIVSFLGMNTVTAPLKAVVDRLRTRVDGETCFRKKISSVRCW